MSKESNYQFIHQLMSSLQMIQNHINEPEVIQSILDKVMPREEELDSILGNIDTTPDNSGSDDDNHFGEEQAEGLDSLLEGLKDGPKDERW